MEENVTHIFEGINHDPRARGSCNERSFPLDRRIGTPVPFLPAAFSSHFSAGILGFVSFVKFLPRPRASGVCYRGNDVNDTRLNAC